MSKTLSDHKDSEHFTYSRKWDEIEVMLSKAERVKNMHYTQYLKYKENKNKDKVLYHLRNYKALEGVVKTLRWVLGDMAIRTPLD
tara:strand:+ start:628 stop:882 length:255 start_codon:yes stop_codon:yes gene_type:complete